MDLFLGIFTAFLFLTNTVGINDQVAVIFEDLRKDATFQMRGAQIWLGTKIAKPLSNFMFLSMLVIGAVLGLVSYLNFYVVTEAEREKGIYGLFLIVSLLSMLGLFIWAVLQRRWGHEQYELGPDGKPKVRVVTKGAKILQIKVPAAGYKPRKVKFFFSVFQVAVSFAAVSITLSLHALYVESRSLWLVSMLTRYTGLVIVAVALGIVAWFVEKGGSFFEKLLQIIVEPLASLVPGVTLKNVTEKLFPNGLNLIEERKRAMQIASAASVIALIITPFDLAVFVYPTTIWATVVGGAYIFALIAGWGLRQIGREDIVDTNTERLLTFLFKGGPVIMALVLIPVGTFLSTSISNGLKARWSIFGEAVSDVIQGRYILVDYRHWYHNFGYVFFGGLALAAVLKLTKSDKDHHSRIKTGLRWSLGTIFGYATFIGMFGFLVNNLGLLNTQERYENNLGWTAFSPNVARHEEQLINAQNLVASTTDTSIHLTWQTDAPADCRIEIKEIRNPQGQLVDGVSGLETDDKGRKFLYAVSRRGSDTEFFADINNLAYGWTVVYRVWTKHIAVDSQGKSVVNPNDGMWPAQDPKWENTTALPPVPSSTGTATPSASASASAAPGKATSAPRKGGSNAQPKPALKSSLARMNAGAAEL